MNSVSAPIRATAIAVNLFTIHLLGDAFSPTLIGYISDKTNLQMGMLAMIVAVALSGAMLAVWHAICSASAAEKARRRRARGSLGLMWSELLQHPLVWSSSIFLGAVWLSRLFAVGLNMHKIAEITRPEFDASPVDASGRVPRVSIVVPARNEAEHIEAALVSLLQLDYPDYEVIAVDDRSEDATGAILDRLAGAVAGAGRSVASSAEGASRARSCRRVGWARRMPCGRPGSRRPATGCCSPMPTWSSGADALRRAVVYAERERADHVVLFPTMVMKSAGERMMMAFFQSQFVFAHRPWKVADPKSRDSMGVGAFNLIRREVYERIGTYQRLRMAVLDDMKLGEVVKHEGYRQRGVFGRDLLKLRWVFGAMGMVRNLTKNFFAIFALQRLRSPYWRSAAFCS